MCYKNLGNLGAGSCITKKNKVPGKHSCVLGKGNWKKFKRRIQRSIIAQRWRVNYGYRQKRGQPNSFQFQTDEIVAEMLFFS